MEVEFTHDGYAVTVWVGDVSDDVLDADDCDEQVIDLARDIMTAKGLPFMVRDADSARVL